MKAEETDGMGVLELWLEGESGNYILFSRYSLCGSSKNLPMGFYSFGPDQLKSAKGGYDPPGGTPTLGSDCGKLNELSVSESDFDEIQLILFTALNSNCIRKSDKSESVYSVPYHSFPFPLNVANLETMKSDSRLDESSRAKFREMTEGYSAFEKVASPPSFALVGSGEKALYKQEKRGPRVERRICP
ncbi:MAG: hypothetical protein H7301_07350 [Cryobacterium sp.]|nr:hypothetical protein [Oligoflexia bacterium]